MAGAIYIGCPANAVRRVVRTKPPLRRRIALAVSPYGLAGVMLATGSVGLVAFGLAAGIQALFLAVSG